MVETKPDFNFKNRPLRWRIMDDHYIEREKNPFLAKATNDDTL